MLPNYKAEELPLAASSPSSDLGRGKTFKRITIAVCCVVVLYVSYRVLFQDIVLLVRAAGRQTALIPDREPSLSAASPTVPQYFDTTAELWRGPTATGQAPFLAQTNPVSFAPSATYIPNAPLETAEP